MTDNEIAIKRFLEKQGWTVYHNGWPDFLCFRQIKNGRFQLVCIEAKNYSDKLRKEQQQVHQILIRYGMPVLVVRPPDLKQKIQDISGRAFLCARDLKQLQDHIHHLSSENATLVREIEDMKRLLEQSSVMTEEVYRNLKTTPIIDDQDRAAAAVERLVDPGDNKGD